MKSINQFLRYCFNYLGLEVNKSTKIPAHLYRKYKTFTMLPQITFNDNLQICREFENVNGSIVECGVWCGGMIAGIAEMLGNKHDYLLFDSFEGLPAAKEIDGISALNWQKKINDPSYYDNCKADITFAETAMRLSNAVNYKIFKGWFSETIPNCNVEKIAILRLDADWYDSTMECLMYLFPKVVRGGCIIIDDYYTWSGCSKAVHDYLSLNKLDMRIYQKNNRVCYLVKS